jgi:hypothetical protein
MWQNQEKSSKPSSFLLNLLESQGDGVSLVSVNELNCLLEYVHFVRFMDYGVPNFSVEAGDKDFPAAFLDETNILI